jgi:hypothetical protein
MVHVVVQVQAEGIKFHAWRHDRGWPDLQHVQIIQEEQLNIATLTLHHSPTDYTQI